MKNIQPGNIIIGGVGANRLVKMLQGLLVLAAIGGPIGLYLTWSAMQQAQEFETKGLTAMAHIEGGVETTHRGQSGSSTYTIDLTWRDSRGEIREAKKIPISNKLASKIIIKPYFSYVAPSASTHTDTLSNEPLKILYLPDSPDVRPIIVADTTEHDFGLSLRLCSFATAIGVLGLSIMFFVRRPRPNAAASGGAHEPVRVDLTQCRERLDKAFWPASVCTVLTTVKPRFSSTTDIDAGSG